MDTYDMQDTSSWCDLTHPTGHHLVALETHFIQGLTCGHRLAHRMTSMLAWRNYLNDAHACPVRCSHMWPPDKAPQECCQIGQQELVCGNSCTKQPLSNRYTRGIFRRGQQEVPWLLSSGLGAGQCWAQASPREQLTEKGCWPEPCRLPWFLLHL